MGGKGARSSAESLIESHEGFLHSREVAGCDVNIADEFIDVFGDDLKLNGYVGEAFAVGSLLSRQLVHCS